MRRRETLRTLSIVGAAGVTGCVGPLGDDSSTSDADETTTDRPAVDGDTPTPEASAPDATFFVSPRGDDGWSGTRPSPVDGGTDGPFRTVGRAHEAVRSAVDDGRSEPITVSIRGGRYRLSEPLVFDEAERSYPPVTYAAYPGEVPVLSGGRPVTGWESTTVNGVDAWKTTIDAVADGEWSFKQLFVDGERRPRPRIPDRTDEAFRDGENHTLEEWGMHEISEVPPGVEQPPGLGGPENRRFVTEHVDPDWRNLTDVEIVMFSRWMDERTHVEAFDAETNTVTVANRTFHVSNITDSRFYVENVFEALSKPGQWYLDTDTGECYYVPREDESIGDTRFVAPALERLVEIRGDGEGSYASDVTVSGIVFAHTRWSFQPPRGADSQAEHVPAAVFLRDARECTFERCAFRHLGTFGVEIERASRNNRITRCDFRDLGGGAAQIGQETHRDFQGDISETAEWKRNRGNAVEHCRVKRYGRVFRRSTAFLVENAAETRVEHCHAYDAFQPAITAGGQLGFDPSVDGDNTFAFNHFHDVGRGLFNHVSGIYVRGRNPGTVVRGNYVHDTSGYNRVFALHLDLGCTDTTWEHNVTHGVDFAIQQHYGRRNTFRNNVLVSEGPAIVRLAKPEADHLDLRFERNVFRSRGDEEARIYDVAVDALESEDNLFWSDELGSEIPIGVVPRFEEALPLPSWRRFTDHDDDSVTRDPGTVEPGSDRDTVGDGVPAGAIDFEPIDTSSFGPVARDDSDT
jgi:hypothetical protein